MNKINKINEINNIDKIEITKSIKYCQIKTCVHKVNFLFNSICIKGASTIFFDCVLRKQNELEKKKRKGNKRKFKRTHKNKACFNSLSRCVSFLHIWRYKNSPCFNSLLRCVTYICIERHKTTKFNDCSDIFQLSPKLPNTAILSAKRFSIVHCIDFLHFFLIPFILYFFLILS